MAWNETTLYDLEMVATLSDKANEASIEMLKRDDQLTAELRRLARQGYSVDALSEASGLSPDAVRKRTDSDRTLL